MLTRLSISDVIGVDTENQKHHSHRGNLRKLLPPRRSPGNVSPPQRSTQSNCYHMRLSVIRLSVSVWAFGEDIFSFLPRWWYVITGEGLIMCDIRRSDAGKVVKRSSPQKGEWWSGSLSDLSWTHTRPILKNVTDHRPKDNSSQLFNQYNHLKAHTDVWQYIQNTRPHTCRW